MSMIYKANIFDYDSFQREFAPQLYSVLETNDSSLLIEFIEDNREMLKSPLGQSLDSSWQSLELNWTVQDYGNLAITKYYDPLVGNLLLPQWQPIDEFLHAKLGEDTTILFGEPFGPEENIFDPGTMGTYFQSPDEVLTSSEILNELANRNPKLLRQLDSFDEVVALFQSAALGKMGLYVRF